ncbi:MAG: hypothetical protein ACLQG3_16230 [Terracidiphilus sp.]
MANTCSKCGAELFPGVQSCTSCGTSVEGAGEAATPAQPGATAAPAQPVAVPPPAAPAKSGNTALKIVLIVVAVFIALGLLVAGAFGFFVWRIAHAVHEASSGHQITLPTGNGTITAGTSENYTAADLGVDPYPGAQSAKGGMRMTLPTGTMVSAVYVTSDSKDQVVSFYKSKLGSDVSVFDTSEASILTAKKGEQESVMITVKGNSSEYSGKTQITIVHTTATKPS